MVRFFWNTEQKVQITFSKQKFSFKNRFNYKVYKSVRVTVNTKLSYKVSVKQHSKLGLCTAYGENWARYNVPVFIKVDPNLGTRVFVVDLNLVEYLI